MTVNQDRGEILINYMFSKYDRVTRSFTDFHLVATCFLQIIMNGLGSILQGTLETSNVNVTEELVNLIEGQRLYEMNSKVISAVDQMLGQVIQQL